ncbi:MAG: hypothetical protein AAFY02_00755 [Pseudomonadota bacterium]
MQRFLLTWTGAFLGVVAILAAIGPLMEPWPLWLRALVLSGLMVALMQRLVAPLVQRTLAAGQAITRRSSFR